jgi:hypothetical protein
MAHRCECEVKEATVEVNQHLGRLTR